MGEAVTVASYNIRKAIGADRRRRPDRVLDVLDEVDADIVALQEADRRFGTRASAIPPHLLDAHGGWHAVGFETRPGSMGWHGNAILVRGHVEILRHDVWTLPTLEPRGAVVADLAVGDCRLRVVGMHLDLSGLRRRQQARAVLNHIAAAPERMPVVMMGDLNEWSADRGCLRDFAHDHHFAETGPSFHARKPIARLDRIMLSREIAVEASGTHLSPLARVTSDHLPVWARLRV